MSKNREKLLAIIAGGAVLLLVLNWVVFSPMIDSWHSRSKHITDLKRQIADGTQLIQRADVISSHWTDMQTNALDSNPAAAEAELLTAFNHWVNESGVTEGSFRPQFHDSEDNYATIDCRADVSGNMDAIRLFLHAMEKDPLAVKVDSLELSSRDDNGQQMSLALEMSGLILPVATQ